MKEENAEDLVSYLTELHLATPLLTKGILEYNASNEFVVKGQLYPPYGDRLQFDYSINKSHEDAFEVPFYNVKLIEFPEINHVAGAIVDTEKLEERLRKVNWNQDLGETMLQSPDVDFLITELLMLKLSNPQIADQLIVKYWSGTPMEYQPYFDIAEMPVQKDFSIPITGNYSDIDVIEAYHIMKGRAVMKSELTEDDFIGGLTTHWVCLEEGQLVKLPAYDIESQVKQISFKDPLTPKMFLDCMSDLCKGEQVPISILTKDQLIEGKLEADPKNKTLIFFDHTGTQIPLPEISEKPKQELHAEKKERPALAPREKRKGRHL